MSDRDRLRALVDRVAGRLRLVAAVEASGIGAAAGLAVAVALLLTARARGDGGLSPLLPLAAGLAGALTAALAACLRTRGAGLRTAAARALDEAAARSAGAPDGARMQVALALLDRPGSPFVAAAIADAVERVGGLALPASSPWRRPRGLAAVALLVLLAGGVLAWPSSGSHRRAGTSGAGAALPAELARRRALAEIREIERRADQAGDAELAALAGELGRLLTRAGAAGQGQAGDEDRLPALAAELQAKADEGSRTALVLAEVGRVLMLTPQTRALGEAFSAFDGRAIAREAAALARSGPASGERSVAETLAAAAAAARAAGAERGGPGGGAGARDRSQAPEPRRRLSGLDGQPRRDEAGNDERSQGATTVPAASPEQRRLERLARELDEAAESCPENDERCRERSGERADALAAPAPAGATAPLRERLARLARELEAGGRAGSGRAGATEADRVARAQEAFERGARGQSSRGAGRAQGDGTFAPLGAGGNHRPYAPGDGDQTGPAAAGADDETGRAPGDGDRTGPAAAVGEGSGASSSGQTAGAGVGLASGSDGRGAGASAGGDRAPGASPKPATPAGPTIGLELAAGAGPSRAQAIAGGATLGFAGPAYAPVYRSYRAAVEEVLDQGEVPAGRRALVKRYFQLIRPR